jgi:long-chain acyl-CoA synthetase
MRRSLVDTLVDRTVRADPAGLALADGERRLTYAELDDEVARAAAVLAARGVRTGSGVAASGSNRIDLVVVFLATMRLGGRWLGLARGTPPVDLEFFLRHSRARLYLCDEDCTPDDARATNAKVVTFGAEGSWRAAVRRAAPRRPNWKVDSFAAAGIAYTSGTTGRPKAVVHSQHNLTLPGRWLATTADFAAGSVVGVALPCTTLNVLLVSVLPALFAGCPCILVPKLEASTIAAWIAAEGITNLSIPPPVLYDLATRDDIEADALATLHAPRTGGAELPEPTRAAFHARFGRDVVGTYGLTEAPATVTLEPRDVPHIPGSSGRVVPYLELRIIGDDGSVLAAGDTGEIAIVAASRGPWRNEWRPMLGYWRRPAASRDILSNGMVLTGDVGRVDDEGNLYVLDRKGRLVHRGGANVYPAEVERVLGELPGVVHSTVVGVPDPRLGERVAVAIEVEPGSTLSRDVVLEHCRARLPRYKVPEFVGFFATLPRNSLGKVIVPTVRDSIVSAIANGSAS